MNKKAIFKNGANKNLTHPKNTKGITLVALVVTIVVLLILAGVSIGMLTGENGIIKQAQNSKEQTEIGEEKDFINLAVSAITADKISRGDTSKITSDELQNEIKNYTNKATVTGDETLIVTYTSGRKYEVDGNVNLNIPEQSYDGMYSIDGLEGQISPSDLFEYEKIDDATVRILRINPQYCNGNGYNPETNSYDLTNTNYEINYNGTKISDTLVIPFEVEGKYVNGGQENEMYKVVEVNLFVAGSDYSGSDVFPKVQTVIYPNTVEKVYGTYHDSNDGQSRSTLQNVVLSKNLKEIGECSFYMCGNLKNITIPSSVTSIGSYAFYECTSLTEITIPDGVTSIDNSVFLWCTGLTQITIPSSVTSIGSYAFTGCSNLKNINIKKEEDSISGAPWGASSNIVNWNYTGE